MKPVWLIEAGVYGREVEPLLAEIRHQGMHAELLPHSALTRGRGGEQLLRVNGEALPSGSCVIAYGTFPFARQIQLHQDWTPGAWCNPDNLDCATYYPHFARFLLNQRYEILGGREAIEQRDRLFDALGVDDELFARPTECGKLFVGRLVSRDDFRDALAPARYLSDARVLVAPPQEIEREWRLVVAGDRVIAASRYAVAGERDVEAGCPRAVRDFAETMLVQVHWRPDPIFMLDVCESGGRLWLVELNGFSCSWLYACDFAEVVAVASSLATSTPS